VYYDTRGKIPAALSPSSRKVTSLASTQKKCDLMYFIVALGIKKANKFNVQYTKLNKASKRPRNPRFDEVLNHFQRGMSRAVL